MAFVLPPTVEVKIYVVKVASSWLDAVCCFCFDSGKLVKKLINAIARHKPTENKNE